MGSSPTSKKKKQPKRLQFANSTNDEIQLIDSSDLNLPAGGVGKGISSKKVIKLIDVDRAVLSSLYKSQPIVVTNGEVYASNKYVGRIPEKYLITQASGVINKLLPEEGEVWVKI